jgi:hypothetical protein
MSPTCLSFFAFLFGTGERTETIMAVVDNHRERERYDIHAIADEVEVRRNLQNHRKCEPDESSFLKGSATVTNGEQTAIIPRRLAAPRNRLEIYFILGIACLTSTFFSMRNAGRVVYMQQDMSAISTRNIDPFNITSVQQSPVYLGDGGASVITIRNKQADKTELLRRLHSLVNETQQDVIVNLFTPIDNNAHSTWNAITCVTQGGVNKLPRLLAMTSRWLGPVSFSTLITSASDLDVLFQFWTDNPLIQEYVSIHVLMALPQLYPINQLRNLALHNVMTDYVFLNDVDFIPSDHAHDEIAQLIKASPLYPKTFWVLPAFERRLTPAIGNKTAEEDEVTDVAMIPKTKPELLKAIQDQVVTTFHPYFSKGHRPTNFAKWYKFDDATSMMYPINFGVAFEPYVVCKTQDLHQYFPLFRGYGFNKNTFFVEATIRNFAYFVLKRQFVVHMNHHNGRTARSVDENQNNYPAKRAFEEYLANTYGVSCDEVCRVFPYCVIKNRV